MGSNLIAAYRQRLALISGLSQLCNCIVHTLVFYENIPKGWTREHSPLNKGKYQYGWPPRPYWLGLGCFENEQNISNLFLMQPIPNQ